MQEHHQEDLTLDADWKHVEVVDVMMVRDMIEAEELERIIYFFIFIFFRMPKPRPRDFKVYECTTDVNHYQRWCPCYHNSGDRRRDPDQYTYVPITCRAFTRKNTITAQQKCDHGDACLYSHTRFELQYHPWYFKTRLCPFNYDYPCQNRVCCYAHTLDELTELDASQFETSDETLHAIIDKFKYYASKMSVKSTYDTADKVSTFLSMM